MSSQDTKNNKTQKSGGKSLLFSLWEKLSGGGRAQEEEPEEQETEEPEERQDTEPGV